jgi:hypothetical protein
MMAALYVMQIEGIVIKDFSMEKNVFIKDMSLHGNVTSYWKYIINGIEYYIPNHGYLVMIDSNFRELNKSETDKFAAAKPPEQPGPLVALDASGPETNTADVAIGSVNVETRKLKGVIFGDENAEYTKEHIKNEVFDMFKSVTNGNIFGNDFMNHGGTSIPDEVSSLFTRIGKDYSSSGAETNIGKYIKKHMTMFMHNRIGTLLKESEIVNVQNGIITDMKCGDIVTYRDNDGAQRFCMFIETKDGKCTIMTRQLHNSPEITSQVAPNGNVGGYSRVNPIVQTFKVNESNLNEEDLLETYAIYETK